MLIQVGGAMHTNFLENNNFFYQTLLQSCGRSILELTPSLWPTQEQLQKSLYFIS
jgi:hypothetical protein